MSLHINLTATDEDGIETNADFTSKFEYEEDYRDFIVLIFKFLMKNGIDIPEEIAEMMREL
tara:strand:+ start:282 stop:464 length:183 start_codon:yes stop_codon:yes gene_type:complete